MDPPHPTWLDLQPDWPVSNSYTNTWFGYTRRQNEKEVVHPWTALQLCLP